MMRPTALTGVDEAGRGPLAGPVVAAAVILPATGTLAGLNDSKRLSAERRESLALRIRDWASCWSVGAATSSEIDRYNIHHATLLAMRRAVLGLRRLPAYVVVDGRFFPPIASSGEAMVKADQKVPAVSAASIIAKTVRDHYMTSLDQRYPGYNFTGHKGYPTAHHVKTLQVLGPCPEHRQSFGPVKALSHRAIHRTNAGEAGER